MIGEFTMKLIGGASIGVGRVFDIIEATKVDVCAISSDPSNPLTVFAVPRDTLESRFIIATTTAILQIFDLICFSQIDDAVVGTVTVDVIDPLGWPDAVDIEPCQSVRPSARARNSNIDIAASRRSAGYIAGMHARSCNFPAENARLRVVIQQFSQAVMRDKGSGSHRSISSRRVIRKASAAANGLAFRHHSPSRRFPQSRAA